MTDISRRQFLLAAPPFALALAGNASLPTFAAAADARFGPAYPFDFDSLRDKARALAAKPYVAPTPPVPGMIARIDFDTVQKIRFRADKALMSGASWPFAVRLFHLNKFNTLPVDIHLVKGTLAQRVVYSATDFDYDTTGLDKTLPADLGFSGFRVMNGAGAETDWLAFQGASYFRSCGEEGQYGASARGIAVDTGLARAEEFPRFTGFWLTEPDPKHPTIVIYALLDGPSLTGAYRFEATRTNGAVMDVRADLFMREDIERLGVAPLTSMYWYGENERRRATDWRPEIHDSDGLALWTGKGERIWRPLIDPPSVLTNSFFDKSPKGFGLMQRDHAFANYQDDGAFYNRRPSIWVEPLTSWGKGAVQLVEIPTEDEIHDNIVAYWVPEKAARAGDELSYSYRLYWQDDEPNPPSTIARVVATRIGQGGVPGQPRPDDRSKRKFVIDFAGGTLSQMAPRYDIEPVVSTSRGNVDNAYVIKIVGTDRWRALFDVDTTGSDQIDLRCYLRLDGKALTETWLYQYFPEV